MDQRQDKAIRATGRLLNLLSDNLLITDNPFAVKGDDTDIGVVEYIEYCEMPPTTELGSEAQDVVKVAEEAVTRKVASGAMTGTQVDQVEAEKEKLRLCVGWMLDTNSRALIGKMETIGTFNTTIKLLKPAEACFTGYDGAYFRSTVHALGIKVAPARDLSRAKLRSEDYQPMSETLGLPLLGPMDDNSCGMEVTYDRPLDLRDGGLYGIVSRGVALVAACRGYEHLGRLLVPVIWPGVWPEGPRNCVCYGLMPAKYVLMTKA